ncbi:MAG TPA: hypothetical protein VFQ80_18860 [Thermomicrobiales bacterium]|nr:hypothetical protein [Thermomicrobiales bacterium]
MARLLAALFVCLLLTGCAPAAFGLDDAPLAESRLAFAGGCEQGCLWLPQFAELTSQLSFLEAFVLAYDHAPAFRPIAQAAVRKRPTVALRPMPSSRTNAFYVEGPNQIVMSAALLSEPIDVVAGVLAHELTHVAVEAPCLDEEYDAEWIGTQVYGVVLRPGGETALTRSFDDFTRAFADGTARKLTAETYADECG